MVIATDIQQLDLKASMVGKPDVPYEEKIKFTRGELGELPLEVAEKVAYKNMLKLLGEN